MAGKSDRIYWSCRRGMLELDLILIPFYQHKYDELSAAEQAQFVNLLTATDMELYAWLTKREEPEDSGFSHIVNIVREYAQDPTRPRQI